MMVDERRIGAALKAVQGIPTEALEEDVVEDLHRACEWLMAAMNDIGMTGDPGLDGAAELAYLTLQKVRGEEGRETRSGYSESAPGRTWLQQTGLQ
jgi:hypothetical protein